MSKALLFGEKKGSLSQPSRSNRREPELASWSNLQPSASSSGMTRSARMTPAARFGRSLSLPPSSCNS
jgi:hypothetical protein